MLVDHLQNTRQVFKHRAVLKSKYSNLHSLQSLLAYVVSDGSDGIEMYLTIQFDCEPAFWTIEVDDVIPDAVLATELFASQL
jgi:hypothetical protein